MMQAFRNSAKPLIFIVAISFFAWLVLDLSGLTGGGGLLTQTSVGEINGKSVDTRVFQQAVSQATEDRQRQSPEPLGIAAAAQIRDQVWEQFVQETILEDEYRKWGISVSSEEIAAVIRSQPLPQLMGEAQFQTDGQFDQTKYERWLASASGQQFVPLLESQYRSSLLQAKLARHVVAPLYLSDTELWERFKDQRETARIGLVTIDPNAAIADASVPVTPTEIEEYYRTHRKELEREATAWLSYVSVDRRPIASDSTAALERARQLRAEIAGGTSFAEVARRESSDTVSGRQGGDLGTWRKGAFDPEFEKAAWSLSLNTVSQPVLTQFGYHLLEVTKRWADSATGRHILVPIEVTGAHRDQLDARADSLEQLGAERLDPAALDTTARALGLTIQRSGTVVKNRLSALPPDAQVWAFQARPGEHSPVVETPTQYLVARLDSARESGVPRLELIRGEVETLVRLQRKEAEARKLAEQVRQHASQAGATLESVAKTLNLPFSIIGPVARVGAPLNGGQAIGRAFALQPAEISGPVEGRGLVYVMQGIERIPADSAAFTKELPELRQRALDNMRQLHLRQYLSALRSKAKVVDQRDRIYKTAAQVEAEAPVAPGTR
ncbi:MAG TPA: SurA N-terminal domain-containing protein [Gemmatimonadales bacterium]